MADDDIIIPDPPRPGVGKGKGVESITIVRKPRPDKLKPNPAAEERFDIDGCVVWPRAAREEEGGWVQIDGFNVFAPPGADLQADDRVIVRGLMHSVEGTPGDYRTKRGKAKGILATLVRVS